MADGDVDAQIAHAFAGLSIPVATAFLSGSRRYALVAVGVVVMYAAFKEFWFDANYEIPPQTSRDNWTDFAFYCVGCSVACLLILWKLR